ncbi:hypothetical protein FHS64_001800 [Brevundimonas terrae]|nr:hypothetical protein [Brevundimonas terrae]
MLIELLAAAAIHNATDFIANEPNPAPQNSTQQWPTDDKSPARWVLFPPTGKRPFLVINSTSWGYDVAVRYEFNHDGPASNLGYYVATRQTSTGLEEADSRECSFAASLQELRSIPTPEVIVPGTLPLQDWPYPVIAHGNSSITIWGSKQENGAPAELSMSSPDGAIATWVQTFYEKTHGCWKPRA